jgi:hypothetical protein
MWIIEVLKATMDVVERGTCFLTRTRHHGIFFKVHFLTICMEK